MSSHASAAANLRPLRVSLITPTFNQAQFVGATVESVLAQTHTDIEFLVINDGSTDETGHVLRGFGDRIRWIDQENQGQAQTLNRGWTMATGDLLGYLSSDDLLRPEAISQAVATMLAHPEAVACYCDFDLIDSAGRRVRSVQTEDYSKHRLVRDLVCLPGPGAFFRRRAFEAAGGWNPALRQVPDFDFWLRLSRHGDFVRIPKVLADYRVHPESASYRPTTPERADEIIRAVDDFWQADPQDAPEDAAASRAMAQLIAARTHFSSGRLGQGVRRVIRAWLLTPRRSLELLSWRILIGGLLRRGYYSLRGRIVGSAK